MILRGTESERLARKLAFLFFFCARPPRSKTTLPEPPAPAGKVPSVLLLPLRSLRAPHGAGLPRERAKRRRWRSRSHHVQDPSGPSGPARTQSSSRPGGLPARTHGDSDPVQVTQSGCVCVCICVFLHLTSIVGFCVPSSLLPPRFRLARASTGGGGGGGERRIIRR